MEWALTGDLVDGRRAYEVGLVNRLTPPGEALPAALELAATIAANGPLAVRATKRILREAPEWPAARDVRPPAQITNPSGHRRTPARARPRSRRSAPPQWRGV